MKQKNPRKLKEYEAGTTISTWKILESHPYKNKADTYGYKLKVQCLKCSSILIRDKKTIVKAIGNGCRVCHQGNRLDSSGIQIGYFNSLKRNAMSKGRDFKITFDYIIDLYKKQNGICVYTGRKIGFTKNYHRQRKGQTASLDRIDSSKGYVKGNVQWIHKEIQPFKSNRSHDNLVKLCKEIATHLSSKEA